MHLQVLPAMLQSSLACGGLRNGRSGYSSSILLLKSQPSSQCFTRLNKWRPSVQLLLGQLSGYGPSTGNGLTFKTASSRTVRRPHKRYTISNKETLDEGQAEYRQEAHWSAQA